MTVKSVTGRLAFSLFAVCWLAVVSARAGDVHEPAGASPSVPSVPSLVDEVREAILRWEFAALKDAAERLREATPKDDREAFARDYWFAAAQFHTVLIYTEPRPRDTSPSGESLKALSRTASDALKRVLAKDPKNADCHAMLATLYGLRIQASPLSALSLGPRLTRHRKAIDKADSDSPRATYLEGVGRLKNAKNPAAVSVALNILLNAEKLFASAAEKQRDTLAPDWGRAHNSMFIGEAYEKLGRPDKALEWYRKSSEAAPHPERAKEGIERCREATGKE